MNRFGIAIVVLIALAGCGTPQSAGPDLPPASSAPNVQPGVTPPAEGTPVPPAKVDAGELPEGFPRTVWTESTGATLGVVGQEGGCGKASAEVAEQSAGRVVLILIETTSSTAQMCTMDIRFPVLRVDLDQPLGERTVVLKAEQRKA
ncbi:MAG TPA: hypothetical protein VM677_31780 [Actinokineospora sp.]|nr:hypothetical protein [Actinokineospora sp.]